MPSADDPESLVTAYQTGPNGLFLDAPPADLYTPVPTR
jgi:hypothetical protein